jgi:Tfp pilus assembly protein PilO
MKLELRQRDRRAILLLVLASGLYLTISYLVLPAFDRVKAGAEAVADKEDDLRKYRRALISRDHYTQLLEQARKSSSEAEARLIRGDNPSLAQVELQTIVEDIAKNLNISLGPRSISTAHKKDDVFNEITMNISFEGTLNQLTSFLSALRAAPKFVTVRTLQIAPTQVVQEAPSKGELKKTVKVTLMISALLPKPAIAAATPAAKG